MRTPTKRASSPKKSTFSSAAGMNLKRWGQASFTSMRSMKNGNDDKGKLIPITSQFDELMMKNSKLNTTEVSSEAANIAAGQTPEAKPKVYKFFKSRQAATPTANMNEITVTSENKNPIKIREELISAKRTLSLTHKSVTKSPLNRSESKIKEFVKTPIIVTKTTTKDSSNQRTTSQISKVETTNLSTSASGQSQSSGETRVIKKIHPLPVRKSNVKNVTVKPIISAPQQVITPRVPSGVRASRRLASRRGEEGEDTSGTQESVIILPVSQSNVTRTSSRRATEIESIPVTKIEILPDSSNEENVHEMDTSDNFAAIQPEINQINDTGNGDRTVDETATIVSDFVVPSENTIFPVLGETIPEVEHLSSMEISKPEVDVVAPVEVLKPPPPIKKKTFFNRKDRKAEFNTKSFFAAEKDEIDLEIEQQKQQSTSGGNGIEKRDATSAIGFDDDDEEVDLLSKLKRVKKAHQCHDLGETAQFDQDIRYYLSGISEKNNNTTRCLSILGLAEKAMKPEFRMQLRAHDAMPRINKALADAASEPNLAICASALMFVYNQDRLKMDIDPNALSLMLTLLESRSEDDQKVEEKHRTKIVNLVTELKKKGLAQYLKSEDVSAGKLAMETFLGLTSKRAGDWFKEELRKMNGIDFMLNTIMKCADNSHEDNAMFKIDRCMHVLENVTFNNSANQKLVTQYKGKQFIEICINLMKTCRDKILSRSGEVKIFVSTLFSLLRVFTSLTTESAIGCQSIGSFEEILDLLLEFLFTLPSHIQADQRFDLSMIVFCLCINLVEFYSDIRDKIMNDDKNMTALKDYLFDKISEADKVDKATDEMLESHENVQLTEAMQDNLLKQMISKSGTHMEHSLLAACVCLLFGCCVQDNNHYIERLVDSLPNRSFTPLIDVLKKLRDFAHLADIMTQKGKDRVEKCLSIFRHYNIDD